ncbi:MAG TPA: hypothetical protein VL625_09390 [Patescibacteria group bacterium]|nr:hypothetical protein [Patescibacteria group bacterium]
MKMQSRMLQYLAIAMVFALGLWVGPRLGAMLGGNKLAKDAQKRVEQTVMDVSYVCFANVCDNGMGVMERFDLAQRKVYFTASGWNDYLAFVKEQQAALKARTKLPNEKEGIRVKDGTQAYAQQDAGVLKFTAVGDVWYGSGDQQFFRGDKANIEIFLSPASTAPNGIAISGWKVTISPGA